MNTSDEMMSGQAELKLEIRVAPSDILFGHWEAALTLAGDFRTISVATASGPVDAVHGVLYGVQIVHQHWTANRDRATGGICDKAGPC